MGGRLNRTSGQGSGILYSSNGYEDVNHESERNEIGGYVGLEILFPKGVSGQIPSLASKTVVAMSFLILLLIAAFIGSFSDSFIGGFLLAFAAFMALVLIFDLMGYWIG